MQIKNNKTSYGSLSKFFHWIIAILIILMLCGGFLMGSDFVAKSYKGLFYTIHKLSGLTILALMVPRILWTLVNRKPDPSPKTSAIENLAAKFGHVVLYILLFALPLSGWVMSTAADKAPNFFGLFAIPLPGVEINKSLAKLANTIHETAVWICIAIVVLHILAALRHHFVLKDDTLKRMLPNR